MNLQLRCGRRTLRPLGPTKVVVEIGHPSSDEEGTRVRRTIYAKPGVDLSLSVMGGECNPQGPDSARERLIFDLAGVVWEIFNALAPGGFHSLGDFSMA
jgi:hypothetical protein